MGSGRSVCGPQLYLLASLAFFSRTDGTELEVLAAPNLLRVGAEENIFVEIQDCERQENINVDIHVMNHPTKSKRLESTSVTLTRANKFQALAQIRIPATEFSMDPNKKQYVYLQAHFPGRLLEKVVLVSFQSGYIFIQTDKTIYNPGSTVLYRVYAVTPSMMPVGIHPNFRIDALVRIVIMTPDKIILPSDTVSLSSGFYSGSYHFGETASPGLWKVMAYFNRTPWLSYSAEFDVQEHVLPSFEVQLTPMSHFFYPDSPDLTVNIKATYIFGEEVDGMAYVLFGVIHNRQKYGFPRSLQRVEIMGGNGVVMLRRHHIPSDQNLLDLVGSSIFVAVTVLTENRGEIVEAEFRGIKIVTSPYTIHFKKTPKYFKPGMTFDMTVEVLNPDNTPARVALVVFPGPVLAHSAANGIAKLTINTEASTERLRVTATTSDPLLTLERQASATMEALPYSTQRNSYFHIGVDASEVELGETLKIYVFINRQDNARKSFTYLILSRGQLVKHGSFETAGQQLFAMAMTITKEMLPSFRIVGYYHTNDGVVSDSVWVDVKDSCTGKLRLEPMMPRRYYEPRRIFSFKITGDPGARVGLVAVDKGVYVRNNMIHLSQKKVWDTVEEYDTGCTPGAGRDSMSVFYDAGLLFESTSSGTPYRKDLKCPGLSRRKRSTSGDDDDRYIDFQEITSRTRFPGSWLWQDVQLPLCPNDLPNCRTTSVVKHTPMPDSITTWQITGISLSGTSGICVADPLEVVTRKDFFIDLKLPSSAVRGEQLEIKAILHNYSPDLITVRVNLLEKEHVCSSASGHGQYLQQVQVGPQTTQIVPFIIIPMMEGEVHIQVQAAVQDLFMYDGIVKVLRVVPEGILTKSSTTVTLDPAKKGVDGKQVETINSEIPLKYIFPNTPTSTIISVTGREQTSALLEYAISGDSVGSLIVQPRGSGRENMLSMAPLVTATMYLDQTNQWETVGFERRNQALQYITEGHRNQLNFRMVDGSFATGGRRSTELTALVVKVFAIAQHLVYAENRIICDAVRFLIIETQQADGRFIEIGGVYAFNWGTEPDASMTAFCLIAMQQSRTLCAYTYLFSSIAKAVAYLESRLPSLADPYAVAMTSYALANENRLNREILYNFVSSDLSHWPVDHRRSETLEATAYALLALVKTKAFEDARPVARWLSRMQIWTRRYQTVEGTAIVYQALAEYWVNAKEAEYDLNVDILVPGRVKPEKYNINRENYETRTSKFRDINQDVTVTVTGHGEAVLKMVSQYYAVPPEDEKECEMFRLSVKLLPVNVTGSEKIYKLKLEVLYKDSEKDAPMSVLDIGLLTGFTIDTNDLDALSRGLGPTIIKYEINRDLSDRAALIIYLNEVSHTEPMEIAFRMRQTLQVGNLQPAAVTVHEYNGSETQCVKFYHPDRRSGELLTLCRNDVCKCAEEDCGKLKTGKIDNNDRINTAKEITTTQRIDFVYKVKMENITHGSYLDIYPARVLEVIRGGSYDVSYLGKLFTLLSYPRCRAGLDLRGGQTYLIMGSSRDIKKDKESQLYEYFLSGTTWIEYWPTEEDCQTQEHRLKCLGIEELVLLYSLFGCLHQFEENCAKQKTGKVSDDERIAKADEITATRTTDVVFKVRVETFAHGLSTDVYTVKIVEVMKEGNDDDLSLLLGKQFTLLSHPPCRAALYLGKGKTYLFMGSSKDMQKDEENQSYKYALTERTWIEYWPTEAECETAEHMHVCLGIVELVKHTAFECVGSLN